jgi:hypothetical protein
MSSAAQANDKEFNNFVEGALEVYSQFKKPSKAESERFYSFLQAKWSSNECTQNCSVAGYNTGKQYVKEKNVEIKPKKSVQIIKTSL